MITLLWPKTIDRAKEENQEAQILHNNHQDLVLLLI